MEIQDQSQGEISIPANRRGLYVSNRLAASNILIVLASSVLTAQSVVLTGALSGRATDESGAILAGASVVVQNLATGVKQSAATNFTGLYRFPTLTPGSYSISASFRLRETQLFPSACLTTDSMCRIRSGLYRA